MIKEVLYEIYNDAKNLNYKLSIECFHRAPNNQFR